MLLHKFSLILVLKFILLVVQAPPNHEIFYVSWFVRAMIDKCNYSEVDNDLLSYHHDVIT